jgi:hypothetical protein
MPHGDASPIVPGHRDRPNIGTQQDVNERGRIPADIVAQFEAANGK